MSRTSTKSEQQRFHEKYIQNQETGCWEWVAAKTKDGYGMFQPSKVGKSFPTVMTAHRFSWIVANPNQTMPEDVMHQCHNPCCVNPKHLQGGTHAENIQDRYRKERQRVQATCTVLHLYNNATIQ